MFKAVVTVRVVSVIDCGMRPSGRSSHACACGYYRTRRSTNHGLCRE